MTVHLNTPERASPLLLGAMIGVLLLSAIAIASILGVFPGGLPQLARTSAVVPPVGAGGANAAPACANCGTVLAIRTYELREELTPLNASAGAAPGSLTVAPGVTSPRDGRDGPRFVYRVTVRMDDGSYRTLSQSATPAFSVGDKVRVIQSALVGNKS